MAIKVIAEKTLEVQASTRNFDKATALGMKFPEKHYLEPGSIPVGVTHIKCRYYYEVPDEKSGD